MKTRIFQIGIVGFGRIAESAHVPAWLAVPMADVVAVADTCPVQRTAALAMLPHARVYATCAEMLRAERLDVLDICTPPSDHRPSILAGCAAGVPRIVCEKPLTTRPEEYQAIAAAQAASNSYLYTINSWLQSDLHHLVQGVLSEGLIGQVTHVGLRTLRPDCALGAPGWQPRWRTDPKYAGGGIVLDHGWHQLYLMANWIGASPNGVTATMETVVPAHAPVEDQATIDLDFPAATGRIELSWAAPTRTNDGEIIGTQGRIMIEDDRLVIHTAAGHQIRPYHERLSDSSYHPEWFTALFSQVLRDDGNVTGRDNLKEAKMLLTTLCGAYSHRAEPAGVAACS
jgi:predicted dehydrogenase